MVLSLLSCHLFSICPICFSLFPLFLPSFGLIKYVSIILFSFFVDFLAMTLFCNLSIVIRLIVHIHNLSHSAFRWYYYHFMYNIVTLQELISNFPQKLLCYCLHAFYFHIHHKPHMMWLSCLFRQVSVKYTCIMKIYLICLPRKVPVPVLPIPVYRAACLPGVLLLPEGHPLTFLTAQVFWRVILSASVCL